MMKIKLTCDACGGEAVFDKRSEWGNWQAHQALHKKGCEYKAHCHPVSYSADDLAIDGVVRHKKGDPFLTTIKDHEGVGRQITREFVEQWYVGEPNGLPLRSEVVG